MLLNNPQAHKHPGSYDRLPFDHAGNPKGEQVPQEFPKYKHHATHPSKIVKTAAEEAALGEDWSDFPVVEGAAKPVVEVPAPPAAADPEPKTEA